MSDKTTITLTINGRDHAIAVEPRRTLVDAIREDCGQTGTHIGCEHGICGACTVIVDGAAVRSCVTPVSSIGGASVTTLEGLGAPGQLHALQQAFIDEQAAQCGYCSSGMIMSAKALLDTNKNPSESDIRQALAGNLCRCGTHVRIIRAVQRAARSLDANQ